jgi:hypothetical protein
MDEQGLKTAMRLLALEHVLAVLLATECAQSDDPSEAVEQLRGAFKTGATVTTFPGLEAVASDLAASELEEALDRLVSRTKALVIGRMQRER